MILSSLVPYLSACFQSIEKLTEVDVAKFDAIGLAHNSADTPGQVHEVAQALSRFAIRTASGRFAVMAAGRRWTRDELLVGLNLYHKLTFGQLHARQPAIVELAEKLDRGANSLAMKLCNFASLDPALKLRGIKGLEGASALDREVWTEFHGNLNQIAPASEEALRKLFRVDDGAELEVLPREGIRVRKRPPSGPTETTASVKQRRGQEYFRDAVLNNFGGRCGVTQLGMRDLLIASHILPWGTHTTERLNVRNGLCLSRLHDAAFDRGLITFDDSLRLLLSPKLKTELSQRVVAESFGAYEGEPLRLPSDAVLPELAFLSEHRTRFRFKS
jgi:putative restriction endonuclease